MMRVEVFLLDLASSIDKDEPSQLWTFNLEGIETSAPAESIDGSVAEAILLSFEIHFKTILISRLDCEVCNIVWVSCRSEAAIILCQSGSMDGLLYLHNRDEGVGCDSNLACPAQPLHTHRS